MTGQIESVKRLFKVFTLIAPIFEQKIAKLGPKTEQKSA
jgi:hypothetical protein